jgi:hypothetical protein
MLNNTQNTHTRAISVDRTSPFIKSTFMKNIFAKSMVVAIAATVTLTGCSQVIKQGANVGLVFAENHIVPPILAQDDTNMVCISGTSLLPAILATEAMGADATKMAVLLYVGSASCAEDTALEHELAYMRASRAGRIVGLRLLRAVNMRLIKCSKRNGNAIIILSSASNVLL